MDETKRPSRRDLIAKGVAAVGAAVAATTVAAEATTDRRLRRIRPDIKPRARGRLKLNNIPRSRMTPEQLRKDNRARRAEKLLKELGTNVEIQWVKGPRVGGRRIIQING